MSSVSWLMLKNLLRGRRTLRLQRGPDGQLLINCPACSKPIPVLPGKVGEPAFDCPHCGKKDKWATDATSLPEEKPPPLPVTPSRWQMPIVAVVVLAWLAVSVYFDIPNFLALTILLGGMVATGVFLGLRQRRK